jgi:hypothetical protein
MLRAVIASIKGHITALDCFVASLLAMTGGLIQ